MEVINAAQPRSGWRPEHQVPCTEQKWGHWCLTAGHGVTFWLFYWEKIIINLLHVSDVRYFPCYLEKTGLYVWIFLLNQQINSTWLLQSWCKSQQQPGYQLIWWKMTSVLRKDIFPEATFSGQALEQHKSRWSACLYLSTWVSNGEL